MRIFGIVLLFLLAWNGAHWFVLGWLFAPFVPGGWLTLLCLALLLLLPVLALARGFSGAAYPSAATRVWIYRPFWYAQFFLPLISLAALAGVLLGTAVGAPRQAGRVTAAGMAGVLVVASLWGYAGTRRLRVRHLVASLPDLPERLHGMRIVQLSDLHVGPHTSRTHLARIVDAVHAADPHLIVLTGDQVDDFARDVEALDAALGGMHAPLGVIAIPGNHDVYAGWAAVRRGMEGIGWTVLVNDAVEKQWNGARFWVAGTGDPGGYGGPAGPDPSVVPDVARTMDSVPRGEFAIVLAHNPALWPALVERGAALTLSGHTHHGQVSIPRLGWSTASIFLEHAMDMHRRGDSLLYISPGANYWGLPLRIGALPEVSVITLQRGPPQLTG